VSNGLADSAKAGDEHASLGAAAGESSEQEVEVGELLIAARERRRLGPGAGR